MNLTQILSHSIPLVIICLAPLAQLNAFIIAPVTTVTPTEKSRTILSKTSLHLSSDVEIYGLTPELESMCEMFSSVPNEKARYMRMVMMAKQLPPIDPCIQIPENKVPGCLSTVHIDCSSSVDENGSTVVNFVGDSDGVLTKGLLAILLSGLNGHTSEEIQRVNPEFIKLAKIDQTLTPGRNNGFLNMVKVMKIKAAAVTA
uniref:Fe-S metabolism associated domain-containing protein n=1 Tax=Proboscia inermis TaxID=420281 RepID=A0A7S0BW96_9STRA|mmetsp:Transcript_12624/g.12713  ORF Transcript_12624/g.12713 Transcript_12624/m.12713 type:complete len:201 (+) Transcript_12624:2-604(+)